MPTVICCDGLLTDERPARLSYSMEWLNNSYGVFCAPHPTLSSKGARGLNKLILSRSHVSPVWLPTESSP